MMKKHQLLFRTARLIIASLFIFVTVMFSGHVSAIADEGDAHSLMGEGNEQNVAPMEKTGLFRSFNLFKSTDANDGNIVTDKARRFSDLNLYDEETAKSLAKELNLTGKVVAVPRDRAIQNGEFLDGSTHDSPSTTWSIEGDYGFVPTFGSKTEVTVFEDADGSGDYKEKVIYKLNQATNITEKVTGSEDLTLFSTNQVSESLSKGGYVKFTNVGYYKGQAVTVVMKPKQVPLQISIGLNKIDLGIGEKDAVKADRASGFMSVSKSGIGKPVGPNYLKKKSDYSDFNHWLNEYGANYVDMEYLFYAAKNDNNWQADLSSNEKDQLSVQGFYTYADFDFEESIGISDEIKINNLYLLQDRGDGTTEGLKHLADPFNVDKFEENYGQGATANDPLGIRINENQDNQFKKYISQYYNENSDWQSQLEYTTKDGYRYFNRGARRNTDEFRISNWLSFTYNETKKFTLRINVSALEDISTMSVEDLRDKIKTTNIDATTAGYTPVQLAQSVDFSSNLMLYKVIDKKLANNSELTVEDVVDVVIGTVGGSGNYIKLTNQADNFDESKDNEKVKIIVYRSGTPKAPAFKEPNDNEYFLKYMKDYYCGIYRKYKKQQVPDSTEEKILDLLYNKLIQQTGSNQYSAYGFNASNIGNFTVAPDKVTGLGDFNVPNTNSFIFNASGNERQTIYNNYATGFPRLGELNRYIVSYDSYNEPVNYSSVISYFMQTNVENQGSNVYFTSDTLLPIAFPDPIKEVVTDDSKVAETEAKGEVVWDILQFVPPRLLNNYEREYSFRDSFNNIQLTDKLLHNDLLKINKVEVHGVDTGEETDRWESTILNNGKDVEVKPDEDWLKEKDFNNRHFRIRLFTSIDKNRAESMTKEEFENYTVHDDGLVDVPNIGYVDMVPREDSEVNHVLKTRPDYSYAAETPTIGQVRLTGDFTINKVAEEDETIKLSGAKFELRKADKKTKLAEGTTDSNGFLQFKNVPVGKHWLYETEAPKGYRAMEPQQVEILPFDNKENQITLKNSRAMLVGDFEKVEKVARNERGQSIGDGQLVAYGEVISYEITASIKAAEDPTELSKLYLIDKLDDGLEKVNETTTVQTNEETPEKLDDAVVWKKANELNTQAITDYSISEDNKVTFKFKVKVKPTAGLIVKNTGTVHGEGFDKENKVIPKELTSNEVTNKLATPVWIRQVIVDKNLNLAIPQDSKTQNRGYVKATNFASENEAISYSTVNISIPSNSLDKNPDYKKINLSPVINSKKYRFETIIPEMYNYQGYYLAKDDKEFSVNNLQIGNPEIDLAKKENRYLTVVLQPKSSEIPMFYNWDYQLNIFNKAITK